MFTMINLAVCFCLMWGTVRYVTDGTVRYGAVRESLGWTADHDGRDDAPQVEILAESTYYIRTVHAYVRGCVDGSGDA